MPLLILLIGAGMRFHALARDARFHPDEALFATFARNAAVKGDWLLHGPLDKTPLTIYAMALSMQFAGVREVKGVLDLDIHAGEFAARVPNAFASILLVAVVYALATCLYRGNARTRRSVSLPAAMVVALSPYAVAFSVTAFTDGLMLLWVTLAVWMAAAGRWGWSGVYVALGYASKQQALLYVPLVAMIGVFVGTRRTRFIVSLGRILRFVMPLALGLAVLWLWDAARAQDAGVWALAQANNDPGRLIRSDEIIPRLNAWLSYSGALLGPGWLTALLGLGGLVALARRVAHEPRQWGTLVDALLFAYLLGYFLLHWLVAFNLYDRYLLLLVPVVVLLAARGIALLLRRKDAKTQSLRIFFLGLWFLVLLFAAWAASEGRVGVGGDLGQHNGIEALAAYLDSKPVATVIYDHWLGWELGYYLGAWHDKRLAYYPTPDALVEDALRLDETGARYLPVPADQPITPWLDALSRAGFGVTRVYDTPQFVVYELIPPEVEPGA